MPIQHEIQHMKKLIISVKPGYDHAVDMVESALRNCRQSISVLEWYLRVETNIPPPDWGYPHLVSEFYEKIIAAKKEYDIEEDKRHMKLHDEYIQRNAAERKKQQELADGPGDGDFGQAGSY